METFSALLALCEGNLPVTGGFPSQRPVTRSFDVFFDQRLNIWLSKQSRRWWFETPSRSLWRHHNEIPTYFAPARAAIVIGAKLCKSFIDAVVNVTNQYRRLESKSWIILMNRSKNLITYYHRFLSHICTCIWYCIHLSFVYFFI